MCTFITGGDVGLPVFGSTSVWLMPIRAERNLPLTHSWRWYLSTRSAVDNKTVRSSTEPNHVRPLPRRRSRFPLDLLCADDSSELEGQHREGVVRTALRRSTPMCARASQKAPVETPRGKTFVRREDAVTSRIGLRPTTIGPLPSPQRARAYRPHLRTLAASEQAAMGVIFASSEASHSPSTLLPHLPELCLVSENVDSSSPPQLATALLPSPTIRSHLLHVRHAARRRAGILHREVVRSAPRTF
ncbi:hypothetical protein PUNSTDRAFT_45621 [Punctularia strigosozonata HHB-11173 SS5]|uniref:uncharacterized protein n=1 Tax=Punctularia strigosozonata (strain HHB-11173) TaxID=741275 RepID=UPI0004418129|nr:uncharacterized protein PUNSTDRAFT_45621 [Punctularia strigosozonata HHB-11173 SS5]EIN07125.1 hypothetical protein PUNSTDRAFT_45621 [Punctularia strigosozonata HHB-11173 SS5]